MHRARNSLDAKGTQEYLGPLCVCVGDSLDAKRIQA
jgi:hypothetical protein